MLCLVGFVLHLPSSLAADETDIQTVKTWLAETTEVVKRDQEMPNEEDWEALLSNVDGDETRAIELLVEVTRGDDGAMGLATFLISSFASPDAFYTVVNEFSSRSSRSTLVNAAWDYRFDRAARESEVSKLSNFLKARDPETVRPLIQRVIRHPTSGGIDLILRCYGTEEQRIFWGPKLEEIKEFGEKQRRAAKGEELLEDEYGTPFSGCTEKLPESPWWIRYHLAWLLTFSPPLAPQEFVDRLNEDENLEEWQFMKEYPPVKQRTTDQIWGLWSEKALLSNGKVRTRYVDQLYQSISANQVALFLADALIKDSSEYSDVKNAVKEISEAVRNQSGKEDSSSDPGVQSRITDAIGELSETSEPNIRRFLVEIVRYRGFAWDNEVVEKTDSFGEPRIQRRLKQNIKRRNRGVQ
ncbi:MAG: hypothetical protein KC964_05690 [Candidatus Omnitrophica bacterium]|nr:hypothetical protein [Candidatus Omnitrophota bacterium]